MRWTCWQYRRNQSQVSEATGLVTELVAVNVSTDLEFVVVVEGIKIGMAPSACLRIIY